MVGENIKVDFTAFHMMCFNPSYVKHHHIARYNKGLTVIERIIQWVRSR